MAASPRPGNASGPARASHATHALTHWDGVGTRHAELSAAERVRGMARSHLPYRNSNGLVGRYDPLEHKP